MVQCVGQRGGAGVVCSSVGSALQHFSLPGNCEQNGRTFDSEAFRAGGGGFASKIQRG